MARKTKNKSAAIRAALAELGSAARNRDVIAHLEAKKITVSAQMVSTVRARMAENPSGVRRRGRLVRKLPAGGISIEALLAAKQLVGEAGSVEAARETLAALAKLI